ncbi:MAG: C45 family autoproteolytic acyltransferase/hydrolase [Desulfobacca sp.]|nr:C45 family autoproteolytic acyltransferase/hydrolase [Desulfobacca sp.]
MSVARPTPQKVISALLRQEAGLRIIRLSGSPAELGYAHGRLLAPEIHELKRGLLNYLAKITGWVGGWPLYLGLAALARRFRPFIPVPYWEEMQGVAAGARVGVHLILLLNVFDDLAQNLPHCSALAARCGYRPNGPWLLARNLDYAVFTEVMARLQTVFLLYPAGEQPLLSVAWPGFVGLYTGMNQSQVALAQLSAMTVDRTFKGCPAGIRNRRALEQGHNLPEVAQWLTAGPRTTGNNLMLCSPEDAVVLELSARYWEPRPATQGLIVATNHYQSAGMQSLKGRFPRRPPLSPLSPWHFTEASSHSRQRRLEELAASGVEISKAQAMLADPQVANPGTVTSIIFAPQDLNLWLAQSLTPPVASGPWRRLTKLFSDSGPEIEAMPA